MRNEADIGKHYERQILALLSLKCLLDESIEDFWIKFNPADVVKFDDIVLHVEYKNGQKELFLVQLKHRKGPTAPMIAKMFQSKKNDSNVECLQEAFKNITEGKKFFINNGISEDTKKFFVLYNNAEVHMGSTEDSDIESVVNEQNTIMESTKQRSTITKLRFEPMDKTDFRSFLSSRTFAESTGYKLKSKKQFHDYNQNFLDNFYFYPDQLNLEEVTPEIERLIGLKHVADHLIHYFDEFTKPTNEKEKIVKLDVKVQVLSSIFGNFQPPAEEESCSTLLNIAKKFDVTLISDEQSENAVWAEIITEMRKNYSENDLEISNWQHRLPENLQEQFPHTRIKDLYFQMVATKKIPLYIKTDNLSLTVFLESTFSKMDVNMVIFNVKKEKLQFTNLKIFETMGDIDKDLFDSFMKNTYISFKGKQKMKLLSIVEFDDSMKEKITVDLFIKLLGKPLKIGDEEKSESIYINRTLRIQMIEEGILEENRKIIFIICNFPPNEKFRKLVFNGTEGIFQTYYNISNVDPYFGLIEEFCNVYTIDKSYGCKFILRKTIGQWDVLKRHISEATKKDSELTKFFEKTEVNFICNKGGMGKSMLLKHLLKMFPPNKWVIHVELGKHRSAFDKIDNFEDFMTYFYESGLAGSDKNFPDISRQLYQYCTKNEKIVLLLDDCDEVVDKKLLLFLKEALNMGVKLWIVARPGLREEFEHFFETFSMELTAFTGKDQMRFFRNFFRERSKSKQELQRKLRSIDKVRRSLENSFIGNCQQTMMLAVLFDTNEETVLKQNRVDEIYEKFINLKIQQQYERNQEFIVRTVSKLALTNFFSKNILSKIFDWAEFQCDIEVFKNENSKTALVTYFDKNNIPEFTHKTYAEFLAGRWLAHTVIKQIVKETPFDLTEVVRTLYLQELTNVRFFFDSILTKSNPLKFRSTGLLETDILSRNILHIYLSYGDRYDMHTVSEVEQAVRKVEEHSHIKYDDGKILVKVPDPVSTTKHTNDKLVKTCMPIIDIKRLCHQKDIFLNMNPVECALLSGCLKKLNEILVYNYVLADFSTMDYNKRFILLVHCTKNHLNFILRRVDKLIMDETLLKIRDMSSTMSLLHMAVKSENLEAIRIFLESFPLRMWGIDDEGNTPIHIAFDRKYSEALDIFQQIEITCDVINQKNRVGYTLLHCAVQQRNLEWTKKILSCPGVEVDAECTYGNTPFMLSLTNNKPQIAKLLKDKNADINHTNKKNCTALHFTSSKGLLKCSEQLIKWGAKLDMKNNYGETPLIRATIKGNKPIVECLLKHDADINACDSNKWTSLHHAVKRKHSAILRLLLEKKAKVDAVNKIGNTPLIIACQIDFPEAIGMLLDNQADMNIRSDKGTALEISVREKHTACTEMIKNKIRDSSNWELNWEY
nr:uncharacterized protein LOC111503175 isoform X2 [Leptinotarsa decemlineata]